MLLTPSSEPEDWPSPVPTDEERALAKALWDADVVDFEARGWWPEEYDGPPPGAPEYEPPSDVETLASLSGAPDAVDLMLLDSIDPASLDHPRAVLAYVQLTQRLDAFTESLRTRALAALAGETASPVLMEERHLEHELAVAMRSSAHTAGASIERARSLTTTFPEFLTELRAGRVSAMHCRLLVDGTRRTSDPDALATIARVLLPKARRLVAGKFAKEVAKAVADFDPDAASRHRKAREQRAVWTRALPDGMSFLGMVHDTPTITAIKNTLDTDADALTKVRKVPAEQRTPEQEARFAAMRAWSDRLIEAQRREEAERAERQAATKAERDALAREARIAAGLPVDDPEPETEPQTVAMDADASDVTAAEASSPAVQAPQPVVLEPGMDELIGACRADALAARILGRMDESGSIDWTPDPGDVQVQLVIDLDTLRGEADRACLLDGQPVPADIGREYAGYAKAFRRMVTDPVTGHLLDYGRTTYLPDPLRTYVLARDDGCRSPICTTHTPRRVQMDHAIPYPDGPSDTTNAGGACLGTHQLKTAGYLHIENSQPDGSCDWITAWGQRVHIPARPYLHDPADHQHRQRDESPPPTPPAPPPHDPPPF